jgi:pilus assembly protein CpaB
MKRRVTAVLAFATIFAVCLSYIVYQTMGTRVGTASAATPLAEVIVATHDIEVGSLVGPYDVKATRWFGSIPKGVAVKADGVVHRGVVTKIYEGEPIFVDRLSAPGAGGGLAATIPRGLRACAVKVNDVVGVAGFVVPGMRVDVLLTGIPPGAPADAGPRVKTLLQNIQVLSAGTNLQRDNEGKPQQVQVVNLLVTPAQAESLSLAGNEAHIQLVLRNPMDTEVVRPPGTAMAQLFDGAAPAPPRFSEPMRRQSQPRPVIAPVESAPAPARVRTIEVINGLTRTDAQFPVTGDTE